MAEPDPAPEVRQLRLVVEAEDFDEAVAFYRDVLGLNEEFYVEALVGAMDRGLVPVRVKRMTPNPPRVGNRYSLHDLTDRANPLCPVRDDAAVSDPVWGSLPGTCGFGHQQRGQLETDSDTNR